MEWGWDARTRDRTTGLPNSAILRDRLHQAVQAARLRRRPVCVLVVALAVADPGDIVAAAAHITRVVRCSDTLARLAASDLALVLPGLGGDRDLARLLERLHGAVEGSIVRTGVAFFPHDAQDAGSLLFLAVRRRHDAAA